MMKSKQAAAAVLLVATTLGSWAAGEGATPTTWEKVKTYTHEQKKEAVAEGKKLIAASDKKLAELSEQVKTSTGQAKAEHEKNMQELKAKKKAAEVQLEKMGKATSNVWDATKEGFSNAGKELQVAYDKAAAVKK
mgnify:CR=1 FL=1|jgi:hypothetical protein